MSLDLRTGEPVWLINDTNKPKHAPLQHNIAADVVIIGGGVSGALLCYALIQNGFQVVMVDSREVGEGSTTASTAILSYETDVDLQDLVKDIGEKKAVRVFRAGIEAVDLIEEIIKTLDDDCGFRRRDNMYFASRNAHVHKMRKEFEIRKRLGFDTEFYEKDELEKQFSFKAPCALRALNTAEVDPVRLTRALVRYAEQKGLKVYSHTTINNYEHTGDKSLLITEEGHTISARHTIFATGYESQVLLKQKKVKLISSYAIATEPIANLPGWLTQITSWETARPYTYLRTTLDNRILAGGADIDFENEKLRDSLIPLKTRKLIRKVRTMFPDIAFNLATAWAGTFAESDDALPYIGVHKDYPGAYFALGYGGNGTTFAAMASRIIPALIEGKKNDDAELFRFGR